MTKTQIVRFTSLTFNTMGAILKPRTRWRFEEIGEILLKLAETRGVDVIALQETFDEKLRDRTIVNPWKEKFRWACASNEKGWHLGCSGLTTLSRFEIVSAQFRAFRRCFGSDCLVNKGVLLTHLKDAQGQEIAVYNAHPQASYLSQHIRSATRMSQIRELIDFIHRTRDPEKPALLLGDLNIEEYNEEYGMLLGELKFIDVMRELYPDRRVYPLKTYRRSNVFRERKLDHILLIPGEGRQWQKGQGFVEVLDFGLSDHRAVLAKIVMSNE